jgi:hypothetical protein
MQEILLFWSWFQKNEATLRQAYDNDDFSTLENLIANKVESLNPEFGWEMGPYSLPDYSFIFSPGSRFLINETRKVIDAAPNLAGWKFFAGKPPKELLSLTFEIEEVEICADNWRYRLTSYNKGEFVDIEIFFENADAPPASKQQIFGELVIESIVGEVVSLDRIGDISYSCVDTYADIQGATSIQQLKKHLDEVLARIH